MNMLYKIVEFSEDDKWIVIASANVEGDDYCYLVRLNKDETDTIDEYQVVKAIFKDGKNYFSGVNDKNLLTKVMPILIPESEKYIKNPEKIKEDLEKM